jgi:hypothetical protein
VAGVAAHRAKMKAPSTAAGAFGSGGRVGGRGLQPADLRQGANCSGVPRSLHHGLLSSSARPAKKSRRATLPANVAVCSVLYPSSRSRAGSGSPSRQISQLQGLA